MTICSYNNSGEIKYGVDIEMAQGYWNTSASRLWTKIRDNFHDELVAMYAKMRANGLSYESLMSYFYGQQISKIPETYYNKDADTKYLPFADQYMGMAHGNGYEHLKRWLKNRLIFTDTLYDYAPSYNNDVLTIRANTTEPMTITIETYTPVYQHLSWYNNQMDKKKIDGKTAITFTGTAQTATDQEVLIYGGSNIKRITGISSMNPNSMLIGSATRLIELDISNCPILATVNATGSNFTPHTYLNKLDISNCPNLTGTLRINNSPLLRELNASGTGIDTIQLPPSVRNLEVLRLPNTVTELTLNDAGLLNTLIFDEGSNLQRISLSNCPGITNSSIDLTKVPTVSLDNSLDKEEIYLSEVTDLTLKNMPTLKRLLFTPNNEYEEFDINNVINGKNYKVTTFNNPNMKEFITTAPHRLSYHNGEYGDITPNKVFSANTLDLSDTQFTDIKFLCTTDLYNLKVPTTMKNFYCDSAMDIDTEVVTEASYDVIHDELVEQYTTNYSDEVYRYEERYVEGYSIPQSNWQEGYQLNNGQIQSQPVGRVSDFFTVSPNTTFSAVSTGLAINQVPYTGVSFYDENKNHIQYFGIHTPVKVPSNGRYARISLSTRIAINEFTINYTGIVSHTPNIIPSSASGSLIFNLYSNNTTQPTSTSPYMWDLTGLKLNDFYTFGMNNQIVELEAYREINPDLLSVCKNYTPTNLNAMEYYGFHKTISKIKLNYLQNVTVTSDTGTNLRIVHNNGKIIDVTSTHLENVDTLFIAYNYDTNNPNYIIINAEEGVYRINPNSIKNEVTNKEIITMTSLELTPTTYIKVCDGTGNITMPQRLPGYSIRMVNADITPNNYANHLYPLLVDTTLPITGKLDYSKYKGTSLAWAYAYTTNDVAITPLGSQQQGNITNEYNKLYGTDYVDIVDVWAYKDDDFSNKSTNEVITKAYIELTSSNYTSRINEVLQWYPNCTDVYLFGDGSVTSLNGMLNNTNTNIKSQIVKVEFIEEYFSSLTRMNNTFEGCSKLTTVLNIPDGVTSMNYTFNNCSSLTTSPNIPNSVTSMNNTFRGCSKLTTVPNIPNSVTNMVYTFYGCSKLTEAPTIPNSVTNMYGTFGTCTSLTTVPNIPNSVTNMNSAFQNCSSLTTVLNIPNSVIYLGDCFKDCTSLTQVTFKNVGEYYVNALNGTFENARNLATLDMGALDLQSVGNTNSTFNGLTNLVDFVAPKNIKASIHGINLSSSTLLSHDILIAILNNLATVESSTLILGETLLGKLTEEEKASAVAKGWTLQ